MVTALSVDIGYAAYQPTNQRNLGEFGQENVEPEKLMLVLAVEPKSMMHITPLPDNVVPGLVPLPAAEVCHVHYTTISKAGTMPEGAVLNSTRTLI